MKIAYGVILLLAVAALAGGGVYWKQADNAAQALKTRQAEALAKAADRQQKAKDAEARQAKEEAAKARYAADEAVKRREAAVAAECEAKANAKRAEEEARKAAENRKAAEALAKKEADARAIAEANERAAEAYRLAAVQTNEAAQAVLAEKVAALHLVERVLQQELAKSNTLALAKGEYEARLANVKQLEQTLLEREMETRPARTVADLIADNTVETEEPEATADQTAVEEAAALERAAAKRLKKAEKPLTPGDKALAESLKSRKISDAAAHIAMREAVAKRLLDLARRAKADGRDIDAEYYITNLLILFPDVQVK